MFKRKNRRTDDRRKYKRGRYAEMVWARYEEKEIGSGKNGFGNEHKKKEDDQNQVVGSN